MVRSTAEQLVHLVCRVSNDVDKFQFHKLGKQVLRKLAKAMNLPAGSYDVRSNLAGIAVSGEVTLHGEFIYVQLEQSCLGPDRGFLARSCKGRKDYTGGRNHWVKWDELTDLNKLAIKLSQIANSD